MAFLILEWRVRHPRQDEFELYEVDDETPGPLVPVNNNGQAQSPDVEVIRLKRLADAAQAKGYSIDQLEKC